MGDYPLLKVLFNERTYIGNDFWQIQVMNRNLSADFPADEEKEFVVYIRRRVFIDGHFETHNIKRNDKAYEEAQKEKALEFLFGLDLMKTFSSFIVVDKCMLYKILNAVFPDIVYVKD